jgi:hypothetical protein
MLLHPSPHRTAAFRQFIPPRAYLFSVPYLDSDHGSVQLPQLESDLTAYYITEYVSCPTHSHDRGDSQALPASFSPWLCTRRLGFLRRLFTVLPNLRGRRRLHTPKIRKMSAEGDFWHERPILCCLHGSSRHWMSFCGDWWQILGEN